MAIEKLYLEHKQTGGRLTADEFNKLPEKVNELIDAQNSEEERVKVVICLKSLTFVVSITTAALEGKYVNEL